MLTGKKLALREKIRQAAEVDPSIVCDRDKTDETFGSNPDYLNDVLGITKSDLIRLERLGLAVKARYETKHPKADLFERVNAKLGPGKTPLVCKTGTHRTRWLIFREVLS